MIMFVCAIASLGIAWLASTMASDLGVSEMKIQKVFFSVLMSVFILLSSMAVVVESAVLRLRRELRREREQLGRKEEST